MLKLLAVLRKASNSKTLLRYFRKKNLQRCQHCRSEHFRVAEGHPKMEKTEIGFGSEINKGEVKVSFKFQVLKV